MVGGSVFRQCSDGGAVLLGTTQAWMQLQMMHFLLVNNLIYTSDTSTAVKIRSKYNPIALIHGAVHTRERARGHKANREDGPMVSGGMTPRHSSGLGRPSRCL